MKDMIRAYREENKNDELLYDVNVRKDEGGGCIIEWGSYPFKCSKICVVEVPFDAKFDESKLDVFRKAVLEYPQTSYKSDDICNFAIYAIDNEGSYIRQKKEIYHYPIEITYRYEDIEKRVVVGKSLFGKKKYEITNHTFLEIRSNTNIKGNEIFYCADEKTNSVFCLPFDLDKDQVYTLEVNCRYNLYSDKSHIKLIYR